MLKIRFVASLLLAACSTLAGAGCSSSDSPTTSSAGSAGATTGGQTNAGGSGGAVGGGGAATGGSGGTNSGGAGAGGSAGSGSAGASNGGASAGGSGGVDTSGPTACAFSVSGGLTEPLTAAPNGCGNGHIEQPNGSGDYTATLGAGFMDASGTIITMACTLSSAKEPAAGDKWTLDEAGQSAGDCQFNTIKGSTATLWAASGTSSPTNGTATVTINSVTKTKGMYHPENVYYFFDVSLTAALKGQSAGAQDITLNGTFKNMALPLGS